MTEKNQIRAHFLANTHLDREWTMDFQATRRLTVDFIDNLLEIMRQVPDYHFLLDGQTVPLEDYTEIRPENRAALSALIKEGRIDIGPWYTALDMNCLSGEAITRNILVGHQVGSAFGPVMKVGYTPFGWGQVSQLPQIYRQFDIHFCIFYRGITSEQAPKAEFVWQGVDDSTLLCSRFSEGGRGAFYFKVWRPAFYAGRQARQRRELDWLDENRPFRLADSYNRYEHGAVLQPERTLDMEVARVQFREIFEAHKEDCLSGELPFAHGMDTTMSDLAEDKMVGACQAWLESGESFFHSSLPAYAAAVQEGTASLDLTRLTGEMKHFEVYPGNSLGVANDIISCRTRQKQFIAQMDSLLTRIVEPFAAVAWLLGRPWPSAFLESAWKEFLKCQAHDTLGGCSPDKIERDATHRLWQVRSIGNMLLRDSLGAIQEQVDTSCAAADEIVLTVFNPSPFQRSETVSAWLAMPRELKSGKGKFVIYDQDRKALPCMAAPSGHYGAIYRDRTDLALFSAADEYEVSFPAREIPPLGYRTFIVGRGGEQVSPEKEVNLSPKSKVLENSLLYASINDNGTIDLTDKQTGRIHRGLLCFEDTGEVGHAWTHLAPVNDRPILSRDNQARIVCEVNTPVLARYRIEVSIKIPADCRRPHNPVAEYDKTGRSGRLRRLKIVSRVTLSSESTSLEVKTTFNNQCRNHRLRVLFPTGIKAASSRADTPYDVVERPVRRDKDNPWSYFPNLTFNFLRFVDVADGKHGFAFAGEGLREYEAMPDKGGVTLAVTMLRGCEIRMCTTSYTDLEQRPDDSLSQGIGEHEFSFFLHPHSGDWRCDSVQREADRLNCPLLPAQTGGGQPGNLPPASSFLELEGEDLVLSAVKKAEEDNRLIVRVFNTSEESCSGSLLCRQPVESAASVGMDEAGEGALPVDNNRVRFEAAPKKIVTLALKCRI